MSAPTAVEDALLRREVHLRKAAARLAKAAQERRTMFACRKGAQKEKVARYFDRMTAAGVGVDLSLPPEGLPRARALRRASQRHAWLVKLKADFS